MIEKILKETGLPYDEGIPAGEILSFFAEFSANINIIKICRGVTLRGDAGEILYLLEISRTLGGGSVTGNIPSPLVTSLQIYARTHQSSVKISYLLPGGWKVAGEESAWREVRRARE